MFNETILIGYAGSDIAYPMQDKTDFATFTMATTRNYKDRNGEWKSVTQWHKINLNGKLASLPVKKGMLLLVKGELKYSTYRTRSGEEVQTAFISAEMVRKIKDSAPASHIDDEEDLPYGG